MRERFPVGTRCTVPQLAGPIVRRPRLENLLSEADRRPVTLVSGPPGAGKTTLLASWLGSPGERPVAWLTLDEHDDDTFRIPGLVVEALRRAGALPGPFEAALSGEDLLDAMFEQLAESGPGWLLVLEDVHALRSAAALDLLAHVVEQAPGALHVVLSARADPPLGWSRLALEGRLGQIRWDDLAFSEAEAAELVAACGVPMEGKDIATLWRRTEGWAAGLRLAIGVLQSEEDPTRFLTHATATDAAVSEYLLAEVLARQDKETEDFLLQTSIAEQLTPELAAALTGNARADDLLRGLRQRGLFLTGRDGAQDYRYHSMFRALLEAHLWLRDADRAKTLHLRAASWHAASGMAAEAERHALAGGDWQLAGRLILEQCLAAMAGKADPWPSAPLAGVPGDAVLQTPELALVASIEACRWAKQEEADLYRSAAEHPSPQCVAGEEWEATWETAGLLCDATYGWSFGVDASSAAAAATLRDSAGAGAEAPRLRQFAALVQAEQGINEGELDHARRALEDLADQNDPAAWPRALASAVVTVIDAASGAVWAAEERLQQVLRRLDGRAMAPAAHFVQLASALCAAQKGGQHAVDGAVPSDPGAVDWSSRSLRCVDRAVRAAVHGSAPFFVSLDEATARHPLAERALLALGALEVLDPKGRPVLLGGAGERVVLDARRHLAEGCLERSEASLRDWLDHPGERHPRTVVEAAVLATIVADWRGDTALAGQRLCTAFDLAKATGILAPVLAHAAHLRRPVSQHVDSLGAAAQMALELLDRTWHPGAHELVEPLTDREVEVLRRLPTLMSNIEIAEALHVSVNTVKSHLKALYRKLGVTSRREAVQRGRELELV